MVFVSSFNTCFLRGQISLLRVFVLSGPDSQGAYDRSENMSFTKGMNLHSLNFITIIGTIIQSPFVKCW